MSLGIAVFRRAAAHDRPGVSTVVSRTLGMLAMPAMLTLAVALSLFATPAVLAAQQRPTPAAPAPDSLLAVHIDSLIDLPTAVQRALEVSPAAIAANASVRTAESERRTASGAFIPTLSANSAVVRSDVTTSPLGDNAIPSSYSAGLSSSIDLFTGGRRGADRARAEADLAASQQNDVAQRFAVTLVAQRAFYETLRASDLVDVARARVTQAERGHRYASDRVREGTTTKSDELRARLELTTGRQQLVAALDTLQTAAYTLGRLVGSNGPVGGKRTADEAPRPLALGDSEIVRLAVDASPAVRAARSSEQATTAATRSARTLYVPDLRLIGGYNWANQTTLAGAVRPGWSLGVATSYPLFNGYQREDAVTRADAAAAVARATAIDATRLARTEAARLLAGLRFAAQNIALATESVQSAQEDLRVQAERYQAGISTELDQLTSQLAVTQARLGLVAARFNYLITRAQLEALVGRSLE